MKAMDVPIGSLVAVNGIVYECKEALEELSCSGCDLYHRSCSGYVICVGYCRKDGQDVIYKEVKQ